MPNCIPPGSTVNKKWLIESLSKIAENQNPVAKLQVMINALVDTEASKSVFYHICALFMLLELTNSQFAATNITTEQEVLKLFNIFMKPMQWSPWTLKSELYKVPERLSIPHIQFAVSVHRLTYCALPMLSGQPHRAFKCVS